MDIKSVLTKKARGYTAREVVEEYAADREDGSLTLVKRKVTRKHVPPDLAALRCLLSEERLPQNELETLSDEELAAERARLLGELEEEKHVDDA